MEEDLEDVTKIKDDLESTKQLLELEVCSRSGSHSPYKATLFQVRSKSLLEKDNKKLQAEIERLKDEFQKMQEGGQPAPEDPGDHREDRGRQRGREEETGSGL